MFIFAGEDLIVCGIFFIRKLFISYNALVDSVGGKNVQGGAIKGTAVF